MLPAFNEYYRQRNLTGFSPGFIIDIKLNRELSFGALANSILHTGEQLPELFRHVVNNEIRHITRQIELDEVIISDPPVGSNGELDWDQIFSQIKIPLEGVNWRIIIFGRNLAVYANHTLFDGVSMRIFAEKIIVNANRYNPGKNMCIYKEHKVSGPVGHLYDLIPTTYMEWLIQKSAPFFVAWVLPLMRSLRSPYRFNKFVWNRGENGQITNKSSRFIFNIPSKRLEHILSECRGNQVSLTAFLISKFVHGLTRIPSTSQTGSMLDITVPVNTRPYLCNLLNIPPDKLDIGLYVCGGTINLNLFCLGSFLDTCKYIQSELLKLKSNQAQKINEIRALNEVDIPSFVRSQQSSPDPLNTFELSNIGCLDVDAVEYPTYEVKDALFIQPMLHAYYFSASVVSSKSGGANLVIAYPFILNDSLMACFNHLSYEWQ